MRQCSISGPILFSIYIHYLANINNKFKCIYICAEYTIIYFNIDDFSSTLLENDVSFKFNQAYILLDHNKLSLNAEKNTVSLQYVYECELPYYSSMQSILTEKVSNCDINR